MRTHVDLFSGIGGFSLACKWAGVKTIAFAEIDPYASRVLQRHWPNVPNYGDVRGFPKLSAWLLTAGVPCQPASVAGKRKGADDDRWLWPETLAVVENGSYEWLLFENPTGILSLNDGLEFERICASLESKGYEVQPLVIPACGVGAKHRRYRVWIVAHSRCRKQSQRGDAIKMLAERDGTKGSADPAGGSGNEPANVAYAECRGRWKPAGATTAAWQSFRASLRQESSFEFGSSGEVMAHANGGNGHRGSGNVQMGRRGRPSAVKEDCYARGDQWSVEPDVGRVAHGIPARVDRLRGLGNAIVPQVAYQLIKRMIEAEVSNLGTTV